jgi:hypothetical protein
MMRAVELYKQERQASGSERVFMTTIYRQPAIFLHIQKTAGTTLATLVRSTYGGDNVISHGDYLRGLTRDPLNGTFSINAQVLNDFKLVPFLSGHFGYDFTKRYMQDRYSFTFLRDPMERIMSFYYYCRKQNPAESDVYKLCQQMPLDEFLKIGLTDPCAKSFIWNHQVWQLASGFGNVENHGVTSFRPSELLDLAIQHIDEFSYVGFAETFEQDRDAILKALGIAIPLENTFYNANPERPVLSDLPDSTKKLLMDLTDLDRTLYEKAWSKKNGTSCEPHAAGGRASCEPQKTNIRASSEVHPSPTGRRSAGRARSFPQKDCYDMTENLEKKSVPQDPLQRVRKDYLDILQVCLTGSIYRDPSQAPFGEPIYVPHVRAKGLDWPAHAQTMIGEKRLANLRTLTESVIADNVPGDLIETGVWRGGACIMMRAVLYAYGITDRKVWVADSFQGLPAANELMYPADTGSNFNSYGQLAVSLEDVQENFRAYGFLDEQTKFLKGWFKDTLPGAPIGQLALMRLDGDMYESTIDALNNLYPKLSPLGYVIIDDYHVVDACKAAVHDYCDKIGIKPELVEIDGVGVYWRKLEAARTEASAEAPNAAVAAPDIQIARIEEAMIGLNRKVTLLLNRALTARDDEIARIKETLTDRDDEVARIDAEAVRLKETLAGRDAEVFRLKETVIDRDAKIAGIHRTLNDRIAEVFKLKEALVDRNGQIARVNRTVADRGAEIVRINQALADRETEMIRLSTELADVLSSSSWLITEPLRVLARFIHQRPPLHWKDACRAVFNAYSRLLRPGR